MSDLDSDDDFLVLIYRRRQLSLKKKRRQREFYVRPINECRLFRGEFSLLCRDVREMDEQQHNFLFRMNKQRFDELLEKVRPFISKRNNHRYPISPRASTGTHVKV
jgi:hypothetical protein